MAEKNFDITAAEIKLKMEKCNVKVSKDTIRHHLHKGGAWYINPLSKPFFTERHRENPKKKGFGKLILFQKNLNAKFMITIYEKGLLLSASKLFGQEKEKWYKGTSLVIVSPDQNPIENNQLPSSLAVKLAASVKKRIEALIESNEDFTIYYNNKAVKVRSRVQRTSYKVLEKLTVIQEAKRIGVLAASCHFAAKEELIKWLNELRQMGIAVTSDQENSEIDDNKDLFEVVKEDSLSAEELED
ncbi:19037_t:CDS:2 [Cetraspora pellucida]|uniref:19037_t:CDS:1 n=1 Tax=Cetraspora pellucida TaxID=1433469 RepID=A0A9N9IE23_9GLOM|nr:19037_t:CDS:2 [Cetraspora pellucida]